MRKTIGIALALCIAVALFVLLDVERGARRAEDMPAAGTVPPSAEASELVPERSNTAEAATAELDGERAQLGEPASRVNVPEMRLLVRDAVDGRPIEGALATLHDRATPLPERTDEEGACVLPLAMPGESVRLRVEAAGHFHWSAAVTCGPNAAVELARAATMHGRVLAADTGAAVPGATVALLHQTCDGCVPERAVADEEGEYELPSVPLRTRALLETRAEGFATVWQGFELSGDGPRIRQDIHLVRGTEIAGRVEDWISGQGIGGARVGHLVADADGRFAGRVRTRGATGWTTLEVRAPDFAPLRAILAAPSGTEHVLRLPRFAFLEGRVMDAAGRPLPGATVHVRTEGPARSDRGVFVETSPLYELPEGWSYLEDEQAVPSDIEGSYRAAILPWGIGCEAVASKRGFQEGVVLFPFAGEPGSVRRQDWWLKTSDEPRVRGRVTLRGRSGLTLAGTVHWRGATRLGSARLSAGCYDIAVEPGEVRLSAAVDLLRGHPTDEVVIRAAEGVTRSVDLDVAAPTATISGWVRFEDGTAIEGLEVLGSCSLPGEPVASTLDCRAITDPSGAYELFVIDLGLVVEVGTSGLADRGENAWTSAEVLPGSRGVDFELPRGYRFFVRLRESGSGAALVPEYDVALLVRGGRQHRFWPLGPSSAPDAGGWFEFRTTLRELDLLALPKASVLPSYGASMLEHIALDGSEPARRELVLERGLDVALELAEGVERWPADHRLWLVAEELSDDIRGARWRNDPFEELAERCTVRFDEHGRARLSGLAPGNYRFKASSADVLVEPELVRLEPGGAAVAVIWSWAR